MTVSTNTAKAVYLTNPRVETYACPFKIFVASQVSVTVVDQTTRAETVLTPAADYLVSGLGAEAGAAVKLTASGKARAGAGNRLVLLRNMAFRQEVDYRPHDVFPAETHERALDVLTMQDQELLEKIDRAIIAPPDMNAGEVTYQTLVDLKAGAEAARNEARGVAEEVKNITSTLFLESGVYNVRAAFVVNAAIPAGSVLTLPVKYFPKRNVLMMHYGGAACAPAAAGTAELSYAYDEIGNDAGRLSDQVRILFDAEPGVVFDLWVVTSALGKNLDAQEAYTNRAEAAAEAALTSEANAAGSETAAENAAGQAAAQAAAAGKSAQAAGASAVAADLSAQAALISEAQAATSETAAAQAADAANQDAQAADLSAQAALVSETNAKASETAAGQSAAEARTSAQAARTSADEADASAQAAAQSAAEAGDSKNTVAGWLADGFDAAQITTGTIDPARLPATALTIVVDVADDAERFSLTADRVQEDDKVYVIAAEKLYQVRDVTKLDSEDGYRPFSAPVLWASIQGKPQFFVPASHAASHGTGGSDPITPAAIGALAAGGKAVSAAQAEAAPWSGITGKPKTFAPSAHAASHKTGGADALTPGDLGAAPASITLADNLASEVLPAVAGGTVQSKIQALRDYAKGLAVKVAGMVGLGGTPSTLAYGNAAAEGSSVNAARSDHQHGMPPAPTSVSGNAGTATKLAAARSLKTRLDSTAAVTFNGLADQEAIPVAGVLPIANGGTGLSASPSLLVNLAGQAADDVLKASPRPGVTGVLPIAHGGTGLTASPSLLVNLAGQAADGLLKASPRPGVTGVLPIAHGGTGAATLAALRSAEQAAVPSAVSAQTLAAATAAGASFTAPSYIVGQNNLVVFLNGLKCLKGSVYNEVGTAGAASATIKMVDALPAGYVIEAISMH